jgi:hypothetical protein
MRPFPYGCGSLRNLSAHRRTIISDIPELGISECIPLTEYNPFRALTPNSAGAGILEHQILYILSFKDESLVKIGLSSDAYMPPVARCYAGYALSSVLISLAV